METPCPVCSSQNRAIRDGGSWPWATITTQDHLQCSPVPRTSSWSAVYDASLFRAIGRSTANAPTFLCLIFTITENAQEMHGNRCKNGDILACQWCTVLCCSLGLDWISLRWTAHTPPHNSLNHGFFSYKGSLFILRSLSVKKQPLLGKIALFVLPCTRSLHILQNYILKGCAKTTGLLFYLRGHFIVADPKPVSRSQNEWDFKNCSHPIVLWSIFWKGANTSLSLYC